LVIGAKRANGFLSPGQTYSFYVTAVDKALNRSGQSNTVTVTTPEDTTPPTAPELSGSVRGPSQVALTWTRSTDDITWWTLGYRIFANGAPVTAHVNWYGERSVVLRHLTPATTYTFTVEANDFNGNTTMSNEVTLTTEATSDVTPPSAPTNVHIVFDQGCAEVWLGWTDGEHLGGEQRGDGGALALLRSGLRDRMLQGRPSALQDRPNTQKRWSCNHVSFVGLISPNARAARSTMPPTGLARRATPRSGLRPSAPRAA
jgi:hypothetical protein